jgi:hypothetical protein
LQELRWVLKDVAGIELPPPALKTIDLKGRLVKDGVRKAVLDRQNALTDLVHAIQEYRKLADSTLLTLQGSDHAHAVQELNKALDRAEALVPMISRPMQCKTTSQKNSMKQVSRIGEYIRFRVTAT